MALYQYETAPKYLVPWDAVVSALPEGSTEDDVTEETLTAGGIKKLTDDEIMMVGIRTIRDDLLKESDWAIHADSPLSPELLEAVKAYRQELRDFPSLIPQPFVEGDVVPDFPTKPPLLKV